MPKVALPDGSRGFLNFRFGSADWKSLIREGSGYWKYTPELAGVRFMTSYDYDVRFGALGRAVDGMAFRPLLGWATAWSFDALRLWLELGLEPERARRVAFVRVAAGVAAAAFLAAGAAAVRSPKWVRVAIPAAGLIALTRWLRVPSNDRPSARRCRRATSALMSSIYARAMGAEVQQTPSADSAPVRLLERRRRLCGGDRLDGTAVAWRTVHDSVSLPRCVAQNHVTGVRLERALHHHQLRLPRWFRARNSLRGSAQRSRLTRRRRFDAYMIYSKGRRKIVDYLGTHQHLAVDLDLSVDERGGLRLRSGAQRFYEGPLGFAFPMALSGVADVSEWFDEADQRFHIDVRVTNGVFGPLFGYTGAFEVEWRPLEPAGVPNAVKPRRGGAPGGARRRSRSLRARAALRRRRRRSVNLRACLRGPSRTRRAR